MSSLVGKRVEYYWCTSKGDRGKVLEDEENAWGERECLVKWDDGRKSIIDPYLLNFEGTRNKCSNMIYIYIP